ncbi:hypothetical protein MUO56_00255 [Candidatus Bathyarchaeota archaeon]|nr:hypothetical protein [Candidatus Bathyarchaeota archaeon]
MKTERKSLDYDAGALAVLVISIGVAAIVYSMGLTGLNVYNLPAWIFGPLGIYTVAYSIIAGKNSTYYLIWGAIMVAVAVVSGFYDKVSVYLVMGILLIVLAIIGIIAYWRSRK